MRGSMAADLRAEEGRSSRTRKTNFTDRESAKDTLTLFSHPNHADGWILALFQRGRNLKQIHCPKAMLRTSLG